MFFKKKKKEEVVKTPVVTEVISNEEVEKRIQELEEIIKTNTDIQYYTELGNCYRDIHQIDKAIEVYEYCLENDSSFGGNIYKDLTKLYNVKRREAAINKDDQALQFYLDKLDGLMQLSKDVMRGKV